MNDDHKRRKRSANPGRTLNAFPVPDALSASETFAKAQKLGIAKANMMPPRAFVLAVLAGLFIGMGGMFMLLVKADAELSLAPSSVLAGLCFSVGLFAVLVGGAELFTGNNLMMLGCLGGSYTPARLIKSWGIVYAGNLAGSLLLVGLLAGADFASLGSGAVGQAAASIAAAKCGLPLHVLFFRGVMCNVLVCLAVWLGFAGKTVVDKFLAAALPVTAFVACGFEHCVANMFLLPYGMVVGGAQAGATVAGMLINLAVVTLGNVVGGALLFAGAYWLAFGLPNNITSGA